MSKRFWTADFHANHGNVARYTNRPCIKKEELNEHGDFISSEAALACATRMNEMLIREANMRVKLDDTVVHVGDFATVGRARGVDGLRTSYREVLNRLNGHWILLEGNHETQGRVKFVGRHLLCNISHFSVFASHHPSDDLHQPPALIEYVKQHCDFQLCGHVHEKWLFKWDGTLLNINVGVDQHKMRPISDDEIVNMYLKEKKEHGL